MRKNSSFTSKVEERFLQLGSEKLMLVEDSATAPPPPNKPPAEEDEFCRRIWRKDDMSSDSLLP